MRFGRAGSGRGRPPVCQSGCDQVVQVKSSRSKTGNHISSRNVLKRVEQLDGEALEITYIPRDQHKSVSKSSDSQHRVLIKLIGSTMHPSRPGSKRAAIHWQDLVSSLDLVKPILDLLSLGGILRTRNLDSRLSLA